MRSMVVVSGSPKFGGRSVANRPSPNWQDFYTTYIPHIVLAKPGGLYYATDPTF